MQVCPSCGESNPDRFTECVFCGTTLAERRETVEERKVLTVVFCDLRDSTALGERLDPEAMGEVLDLYFTGMRRVLTRHGGSIQKFIGDAIVAAFGLPVAHEDDALRACRAAMEMLQALERLNRQLEAAYGIALGVRIGVHTGDVVIRRASNDQELLTGDTLNTAARLEQAADGGQILIGASTYRLVREAVEIERLEPLALKGKADLVAAYRLVRVFGDEQSSRRHEAPIVGREEELRELLNAFARASADRRCRLATVFGEAGVGKSRLVRALIEATEGDATVLRGRCLPYGEGITFWPMLTIVRDAADIAADDPVDLARQKLDALVTDPEVTRRVASALGWSTEELPLAELFWGVRELLELLARHRPLVIVIDDVHWAAPTLLDLLEHLAATIEDGPILLLCTARPDMLEERDWSGGPDGHRLVLDRLPDAATEQVVANLLDGIELSGAVRSVILRTAEGNPLYVEQLVSMLIESGLIVREADAWRATGPIDQIAIPPSIQALLTARLDRLSGEERAVIEPASVIGAEFPATAIRELVPAGERDHVPAHLEQLAQRQLVRPTPADDGAIEDHAFHHVLIRDATYQRALKRARADLHERFAGWLTELDANLGRPAEHDVVIGYHLEQAYGYRRELGPSATGLTQLGERGAAKLAAAGRIAFSRGDLPAATGLLTRAIELLPAFHARRLALLPDLAEAHMEMGEFEMATSVLGEADDPSAAAVNEADVARARLVRLHVELSTGSGREWATRARHEVQASLPVFERVGDHVGMATAWRLAYGIDAAEGQYDAAAAAAEQVIDHARAAGDARQERRASVAYAQSVLYGSTTVDQAARRCGELLAAVEGDRRTESLIQLSLAHLTAMRSEFDIARSLYRGAQHMLRELGRSVLSVSTSLDSAPVEVLARDYEAAEAELRRDLADLDLIGETYLRSTVAGLLARVLALTGHGDEAERIALDVQRSAAADDADAQVLWRSALALRRSEQGRPQEALLLIGEAVELSRAGSDPHRAAQSLTDRATVRAAAGRPDEASDDLREALQIHREKGNVVETAAVEAQLAAGLGAPEAQ